VFCWATILQRYVWQKRICPITDVKEDELRFQRSTHRFVKCDGRLGGDEEIMVISCRNNFLANSESSWQASAIRHYHNPTSWLS
jgi:hypothetical protein